MLNDSITLLAGATVANMVIASGTSFPSSPDIGELFYKTTDGNLYVYDGASWDISGGGVTSINSQTGVVTLTKSDLGLSNVDNTSDANKPVSSAMTTALSGKESTANKNAISGYAGLDASGKIANSQLPALAITDTYVAADQTAMLALSAAEVGDIAVRTDLNKSFILKTAGYSILGNWQELLSPSGGSVTIGSTAIALGASSSTLAGLTSVGATTFTGALTGNASTASNIDGGVAGRIPYQSAASTTVFSTKYNWTDSTLTLTLGDGTVNPSRAAIIKTSNATAGANSSAPDLTLSAGDGLNGVSAGGSLILQGGTNLQGGSGHVIIKTATDNSTSTTLAERFRFAQNGAIGLGGANYGTAGQVLTSSGSSGSPTWTTVTASASASALTGTTLASNVVSSSLTSVGTLTSITSSGAGTFNGIPIGGAGMGLRAFATLGLILQAKAEGSGYDLTILNNTGSGYIMRVPFNTSNTQFDGAMTVNNSITSNNTITATTFSGAGTSLTGTGASFTAGKATNIAGGSVGKIPYQSAADTTVLLNAGAQNYILQANGGAAPSWVNLFRGLMGIGFSVAGGQTAAGSGYPSIWVAGKLNFLGTGSGYAFRNNADSASLINIDNSGNTTFAGTVTCTSLTGAGTGLTGTAANLTAGNATKLATARTINGTSFDGSANISIAGSTLTGTSLASGIVSSSLTSVGSLTSLIVSGSLQANLGGTTNVSIGVGAGASSGNGNNTSVGAQAFATGTGGWNTAIGWQAMYLATTGQGNTALGRGCLGNLTTGSGNIAVGTTNSAGGGAPTFNVTTENNRLVMGHTGITNAYVQVAWTVVSDARDKTDFAAVPHGLDFISNLKPVAYRFKENREDVEGHGPVRYGFKAQDILALEGETPVVIDTECLDKLKLNEQSLLTILVKAVQELSAQVNELKQELNTLK